MENSNEILSFSPISNATTTLSTNLDGWRIPRFKKKLGVIPTALFAVIMAALWVSCFFKSTH